MIICGICLNVDKEKISKWQYWHEKPHKCCTKIKPDIEAVTKRKMSVASRHQHVTAFMTRLVMFRLSEIREEFIYRALV